MFAWTDLLKEQLCLPAIYCRTGSIYNLSMNPLNTIDVLQDENYLGIYLGIDSEVSIDRYRLKTVFNLEFLLLMVARYMFTLRSHSLGVKVVQMINL
jgi:hypothetical protein